MSLNINAEEWKPTGNTIFSDGFALPPSTDTETNNNKGSLFNVNSPAFTPQTYNSITHHNSDSEDDPTQRAVEEYVPSFLLHHQTNDNNNNMSSPFNWEEKFQEVMALTEKLIKEQIEGPTEEEHNNNTNTNNNNNHNQKTGETSPAANAKKAPSVAVTPKPKLMNNNNNNNNQHTSIDLDDGLPPLTANGNRRWKRPTKSQQKREVSQKKAFEEFAAALLHSVSPFMSPLRQYCQSSLPHLKVDQRFGKVGQPQTAIANFIVAPIITTYRPRHFHDLSPGDLLEFHYELSLVLTKGIEGVDKIMIGYGPMWKRYAVPYFYLHCKDYAQQVKRLCPEEIPNSRAEAIYESDIVKNITDIVLVVEQLEVLNNISFLEALRRRVDLSALYDTFQLFFEPIENYTIEITNLNSVPSQFYIKASMTELAQKPQPIVLHGDPNIWEELPTVSRVVVVDEANHHNNHNSHNEKETPYYTENPSTGGRRKGGKKKRNNNHNNNMLMVVVPVLLSAVCIATTAAIVLAKEKRK